MQDALRAPAEDMMGVMDAIQRTFYVGLDPTNMLAAFSKVGAGMDILHLKGVSGAKVLAPLLAMADQSGMKGEASGNALRKVLQMSMDSKKTRAYGLNFTDGKGEHAGLPQMFAQLQKLRAMSTEKRLDVIKDVWGNDAETIQMLTLMIDKGKEGYDNMVAAMQKQADLKTRVDASLGTLSAAWESAEGTWTNLKAAFGEALAPELKDLTKWLGETTAKMQAWTAENPKAARYLTLLAAVMGVLLVVGGGLAIMVAGLMLPMAGLGVLAAALGIGLLPLLAIIAGIGLAIAAVVWVFTSFGDQIGEFFTKVSDLFQNGNWVELGQLLMNTLIDVLSAAFMGAINLLFVTIPKLFVDIGIAIVTGIIKGLIAAVPILLSALGALIDRMSTAVRDFLGIKSPSRVFAEIGGFTAAGLAMGIANGTPAVVSTAATMASQVSVAGSPAFGRSGGGAGAGGGMSIGQVTIVIDGAAGDPQAIARAVEDRLRALQTRQRSDAQARFYQD
jgi:TP901 family phage tail tape measure protein